MDLQTVFNRVEKSKRRAKEIKTIYRDALGSNEEYKEVLQKLRALKERKKQIENSVKEQFNTELTELEDLLIDIASDKEMMTDMALTKLVKGEVIQLRDEHDNEYEPVFGTKFKKIT